MPINNNDQIVADPCNSYHYYNNYQLFALTFNLSKNEALVHGTLWLNLSLLPN